MAGSSSPLQDAVDRFIARNPGWEPFRAAQAKGAKPGATSTGRPSATQSLGGGVAFAEADYTQREYWTAVVINSSDGLFSLEVEPIQSVLLESGDRMTFKQPV